MWKADVVESWIADKENHVRSEDFGRDLSSVQTLLTKQETFDAGLHAFEQEGIQVNLSFKPFFVSFKMLSTVSFEPPSFASSRMIFWLKKSLC